ncbi:hypothetical protein DZC34_19660 [Clostridium botulinum]|nr:hypothetical protein DZC34_19660 [Clostridium botulinum]
MEGWEFNEITAKQKFEALKIKHKYIINLKQIDNDSVIRASSLLNRISWAKQDFNNFNNKIVLSENIRMKEESSEIFLKLQDKYWKVDDVLSEIKVSVEFG